MLPDGMKLLCKWWNELQYPCGVSVYHHTMLMHAAFASQEHKKNLAADFVQEIAETKLPDLNCLNVEAAMKIVAGTAKNMGITVEAAVAA